MRTQVITLDAQDDVISIRDKLHWVKGGRVLLVFPPGSKLPARTLDLLLVQRYASGLGLQLGLVTRSPQTRQAGQELGLPVFPTADAAQEAGWAQAERPIRPMRRSPRRDLRLLQAESRLPEAPWRLNPVLRVVFFSLAAIAILALVVVLLPSSTITLQPKSEVQSTTLSLEAGTEFPSVNPAGSLPAHSTTLTVTGSKTVSVSTRASIPDQPAEGMVRFTNLGLTVVGIPAGTVVRTLTDPPVRFITLQDGVLSGVVGKTLDIPVKAMDAGPSGNLPADALTLVEGSLGASLSATNPEPTSGGTEKTAIVPSGEDRERLHAALLAELRLQAITDLAATLEDGSVVFPDTVVPTGSVNLVFSPDLGQPGEQLSLSMSMDFEAMYSAGSDLRILETAVLDAGLPRGYTALPDTLTASSIGQPATDAEGITRWSVRLERMMHRNIDPIQAASLVRGRRPADAVQRLSAAFELSAAPQIVRVPAFWPWLPFTILRIAIITP